MTTGGAVSAGSQSELNSHTPDRQCLLQRSYGPFSRLARPLGLKLQAVLRQNGIELSPDEDLIKEPCRGRKSIVEVQTASIDGLAQTGCIDPSSRSFLGSS